MNWVHKMKCNESFAVKYTGKEYLIIGMNPLDPKNPWKNVITPKSEGCGFPMNVCLDFFPHGFLRVYTTKTKCEIEVSKVRMGQWMGPFSPMSLLGGFKDVFNVQPY